MSTNRSHPFRLLRAAEDGKVSKLYKSLTELNAQVELDPLDFLAQRCSISLLKVSMCRSHFRLLVTKVDADVELSCSSTRILPLVQIEFPSFLVGSWNDTQPVQLGRYSFLFIC